MLDLILLLEYSVGWHGYLCVIWLAIDVLYGDCIEFGGTSNGCEFGGALNGDELNDVI